MQVNLSYSHTQDDVIVLVTPGSSDNPSQLQLELEKLRETLGRLVPESSWLKQLVLVDWGLTGPSPKAPRGRLWFKYTRQRDRVLRHTPGDPLVDGPATKISGRRPL